jgi:alpha-amylase/alpha-mannosidase (GH57 family)
MGKPRYVCIHGHFYQPPRENPWLEAVEVQDSASPYHDWNERVTRECYAPNARSRLVDAQGRIINLLNNYAWMSFNFGPTLLHWLASSSWQEVLQALVEADRLSRQRHRGHGNALAQVYNHMIMPLASERDKQTQVAWGIADFRRRFQRDPEGMWLPETAVDLATLEVLAAAGLRFTILSPTQARRWRRRGDKEWLEKGSPDPTQAYECRLPSGRSIALFFYDSELSRQVAFERLLNSGEQFLARLLAAFNDQRPHAELVHIATDGETYGHHHPFGDMALAYVLDRLRQHPDIRLTNYGEYLELHPPQWEVEIRENTSWSCPHGVERWRADCGCRLRSDWQQKWRGPMRRAFDLLKEKLDQLFVSRGQKCFPDPWAARNGYIEVLLDRREESVRQFFWRYGHANLGEAEIREGLKLLEMQRHALLMYTSCGWFFDEISGLEATQCLRYALRALQLARELGQDYESLVVAELEKAPSNLPQYRTGRGVWEQLVRPSQVDLNRVLAHQAIRLLYQPERVSGDAGQPCRESAYVYDLECLDTALESRGNSRIGVGRLRVRSRLTWDQAETCFVVIHYGGLDFYTVLGQERTPGFFAEFQKRFLHTYQTGSLADVTTLVAQQFPGEVHRLDDLFLEEQREIIAIVLRDRFADYQRVCEQLATQDEDLLIRLGQLHYPIPKALRAMASVYLDNQLQEEFAGLKQDGRLERIRQLWERSRAWDYQPEREQLARTVTQALGDLFKGIAQDADPPAILARASQLLDGAALLGLNMDLWEPQNRLLDAYARLAQAGNLNDRMRQLFAALAEKLQVAPALLGWHP